jgi:hypothetical protein
MKIHNDQSNYNINQISASKVNSNHQNNSSIQSKIKDEKKAPFKSLHSTPNSSNRNKNKNSSSFQDNNVNSNRNYNQLFKQNKSNNRYDNINNIDVGFRVETRTIPGSIPKTPSGKKIKAFGHPI